MTVSSNGVIVKPQTKRVTLAKQETVGIFSREFDGELLRRLPSASQRFHNEGVAGVTVSP